MSTLLRYLFVVQHDYRSQQATMRARVLLPLSSGSALLLSVFLLLTLSNVIPQERANIHTYAIVVLSLATVIAVLVTWLIQRGMLTLATLLLGGLIAGYAISDVLISATMTTGVVFAMLLVYAALTFGGRGVLLAYGYSVITLLVMLVVRSEGLLGTDQLDDMPSIVFYSFVNLSFVAIILWFFVVRSTAMLVRANRLANQTRATAEVGRSIARILNLDELVTHTVDLIRDRFAFYHVQLFLVDEAGGYGNLVASTGETGAALLAQGYRVPVGPRTAVGEVLSTGEMCYLPRIANTAYRHLERLDNTQTELALPLVVGDEITGALDIHSLRPDAFGSEDIEAMRVTATQISQAIQNARLFESQQRSLLQNRRLFLESETNLREIERLNRELTGQSWQEYMQERLQDDFGVRMVEQDMQTGQVDWTPTMQQATQRNRLVIKEDEGTQILAVPISIRGEPIGAIEVCLDEGQNPSEVRSIVQAVTERMAFSLENARLFEQARMAAEREQQINRVTAQLQGLTSIEDVLTTAINSLGEVLGASEGVVRLVPVEADEPAGNGHAPPAQSGPDQTNPNMRAASQDG
jgi:GAF domain-containing protein